MIRVDVNSLGRPMKPRLDHDAVVALAQVVLPNDVHDQKYHKLFQEHYRKGLVAVLWPDGCGAFVPKTNSTPNSNDLIEAYEEVRNSAELAYLLHTGKGSIKAYWS